MEAYEAEHPEQDLTVEDASGDAVLPTDVKRSLVFLLVSIALWFISYNAIETWFTTYANKMWSMSLGSANLCLTIATGGAIISYVPVGALAAKIGRKKTILIGVCTMTIGFLLAFLYTMVFDYFQAYLYVLFFIIGMSWAGINVNSLPMVLEMCKGSDIGRFTGFYYTFSMAAQIVTPVLAGFLMKHVGYTVLFIYAAVFMGLAFLTMQLVRHGDCKGVAKHGLDAFEDMDD
jgi:MFS family permease